MNTVLWNLKEMFRELNRRVSRTGVQLSEQDSRTYSEAAHMHEHMKDAIVQAVKRDIDRLSK